jgi:hypothetical protein
MRAWYRALLCLFVGISVLMTSVGYAQSSIQPVPVNSLGIHKLVLTNAGLLYVRMNNPVGARDYSNPWDISATIDLAQMFPTPQSFASFNLLSDAQKSAQLAAAGSFVDWSNVQIDPDDIIAEATVLLDLDEPKYSVLQQQFTDHVGAMFHAWYIVLQHPFSSAKEIVRSMGLVSDAPYCTEETWGVVGEYAGKVGSAAWTGGKWVANKVLPVAQAVELCVTAANVIGTSIESGEPPAWEDITELCFDAVECIPGGWGIGAAVAHEAWCWIDS